MFSFIIINYNTVDLTLACLESIFEHCPDSVWEIILVDNNSSNQTLVHFKNKFGSKIKIIANQKNLGFAKANNQGAKLAQGEYLFFLNSDTLVNQNILLSLKSSLEQDKKIGIIAPRLALQNGQEQPYSFKLKTGTNDLAWVSGAALIIRRDIFFRIGGWDERFFMYFEDVDLCQSVFKLGYKIKRDPLSEVSHLVGGSPIPFWKRKLYYYHSKFLFILKDNFNL
jgi:hypothetical protein